MSFTPSLCAKFVEKESEGSVEARMIDGDHEKRVGRHHLMFDGERVVRVSAASGVRDAAASADGAHHVHVRRHRVEGRQHVAARALRHLSDV